MFMKPRWTSQSLRIQVSIRTGFVLVIALLFLSQSLRIQVSIRTPSPHKNPNDFNGKKTPIFCAFELGI